MEGGEAAGVCDSWSAEEGGEDCLETGGIWSCNAGIDVAF